MLILSAICGASGASAQAPEPLDASTARLHFGPLYVSPSLLLKELGVDTNVFNTSTDARSDFTFTLLPQAQALVKAGHRVTIMGTGGADIVYYAVYDNQRFIGGTYDVRAEVAANHLTFFVGDSLVNTRDRPTNEIDVRPRRTEHAARGGVNLKLHKKVSFEVSARAGQLRYDDSVVFDNTVLAHSLDHDTQSVAVSSEYRLTPYTALNIVVDGTRDRFTEDPTRDSDSVSVRPGVTFSPRALISGAASVGVRTFRARSAGVPDYTGVVASGGLSYHFNGSTMLSGTIDRDLAYSYANVTPYYIRTDVGLTLRRQLVGRFDAMFGATHSQYDYQPLTTVGVLPIALVDNRKDATINYLVDVGYRASRKARIGFGVESWHRTSNQRSDRDYTGFRFRSTATVAF